MPSISRRGDALTMQAMFFLCSLLPFGAARAADQPGVQMETLSRSGASWDGTPYVAYPAAAPELTVVKLTIAPHTELPWHTHPMPNAAYILAGEITVEEKQSGAKKVLTQGQVIPEMVNRLHRGRTGDAPVVLIVFYAGAKGMPLAQ